MMTTQHESDCPIVAEDGASAQNEEQDSPETIWRSGLLYRAAEAKDGAIYEKSSAQFATDDELVTAVQAAADAWAELATFLRDADRSQGSVRRRDSWKEYVAAHPWLIGEAPTDSEEFYRLHGGRIAKFEEHLERAYRELRDDINVPAVSDGVLRYALEAFNHLRTAVGISAGSRWRYDLVFEIRNAWHQAGITITDWSGDGPAPTPPWCAIYQVGSKDETYIFDSAATAALAAEIVGRLEAAYVQKEPSGELEDADG
jgi:hypothetical protein